MKPGVVPAAIIASALSFAALASTRAWQGKDEPGMARAADRQAGEKPGAPARLVTSRD